MRLFASLFASSVLALPLLLAASPAQAGGYVGIGIGSQGELDGEISNHFSTDGESDTSRILLGQRFGGLALEASLFGSQLQGNGGFAGTSDYATVSIGADLKYYVGIVGGFEGYAKVGLNKTWLTGPATEGMDFKGRGTEYGAGLQYTLNLPVTQVGLWLDYSIQNTELRDLDMGPASILDGELRMLNLGVSVGF